MTFNVLAVASALSVAAAASAQSARFNVHALISEAGDLQAFVSNSSPSIGALQAELDTSTMGRATADAFSTEFSFRVDGSVAMLNGMSGETLGTGKYTIDGSQPLVVDWNWSSLSGSGNWKVLSSSGATVASLSFLNGVFTSTGGSFGTSSIGTASLNLAAGNYTFWSEFANGGTATSTVNFTFGAIPAPGAIALVGMAGLAGSRRRR